MDDIMQTFRQALLQHLAENELESDALRQLLLAVPNNTVFDDYEVNELLESIEPSELDWNAGYFAHQRKLAQRNFSQKRLNHLIDVREHLMNEGIAGFVRISATAQETKKMTNNNGIGDYTPGDNLADMVLNRTTSLARSALINELEDNRLTIDEVTQAVRWTHERVPDLFIDYEENALAGKMILDPAQWDAEYYYLQTSYINVNFAESRFKHLIEVRNMLRQRGVKGFERIVITRRQPQSRPQQHDQSGYRTASSSTTTASSVQPGFLRVALLAGGALALLAALVISLL
ncbi:hypothetical protein H4F33_17425 [Pectobacterium brasiliense]|uniref:hypothetical protein n=1 Tax=Pectobacterium brasiliense TaxID=180957 RepID=UPI0015E025E6|nr:hypothetical protein [Pectobacterium brasiliense]MBA0217820.1 hypothetical protein [Pectobacterium brasiliense]MBN3073860.1 hypothetical protein [Pectobacterium brasiliense]MBN3169283.1 hypothetical protein [Pectobacterium brasiliense]